MQPAPIGIPGSPATPGLGGPASPAPAGPGAQAGPAAPAFGAKKSQQVAFGCGTDSVQFGHQVRFGKTTQAQAPQDAQEPSGIQKALKAAKKYAIPATEVAVGAVLAIPAALTSHVAGLATFGAGNVIGIGLHIVGGLLAAHGLYAGYKKFKAGQGDELPPTAAVSTPAADDAVAGADDVDAAVDADAPEAPAASDVPDAAGNAGAAADDA